MTELMDRLDQLSVDRRELLELLLERRRASVTGSRIPRRSRSEAPLSFAQQRLWFLERLNPGGTGYHIGRAVRLGGPLDAAALRLALCQMVRRHEVLRTSFHEVDGTPVQRISASAALELPAIDLSALPADRREPEAVRLALEQRRLGFGLATCPLLRVALVRVAAWDYVVLLTLHHIVSDGWSMGVLVREVTRLYTAFAGGEPCSLPDLPIQYADYAEWQRLRLTGLEMQRLLAFWTELLRGIPDMLDLPTDFPRPAVQSSRGAQRSFAVSVEHAAALHAVSRSEGTTLFTVLLAAFQVLLYRYSGQRGFAIGTPVAGREQSETEGLIGFFANTLVLPARLADEASFLDLLRETHRTVLGAQEHQGLPFDQLVQELSPERTLSRSPLFQVMLAFQNTPEERLELSGLSIGSLEVGRSSANFDLSLNAVERAGRLAGTIEYSTDLFEGATILRMTNHLESLLRAAAAAPGTPVSALPLLEEHELQQALREWNDARAGYPEDRCLYELIEEQVDRTPEAVAVVAEERQLSYGELDVRANRLAHHLRGLGVGPEVTVAICVERSLEMIVGLLGILKAGGAYVPLDPEYPRDRLAFMIEDCGALVLLTRRHLAADLPSPTGGIVLLDDDQPCDLGQSAERPIPLARPENLIYVIYTSGSTGRPKGVAVPHSALINYTLSAAETFAIGPGARVLQFASISFDTSAEEIFPSLACGATLVLRSDSMLGSSVRFLRACGELGITMLDLPTAFWHELVAELRPEQPLPLDVRLVVIGGERALASGWAHWGGNTRPGVRLLNTYGPTEATIVATRIELPANPPGEGENPAIGRPVSNASVYLVNRSFQPVPVGVAGEVCIGGAGVARGYLGRPDLTALRFVPDPFGGEPGRRLYRTSDLARQRPDGRIDFLGRIDHQVKIRGFRIEPGEIESALRSHREVDQAVVLTREDRPGDRRLVAYVVARGRGSLGEPEMKAHLRGTLPEHMVPSHVLCLAALPLTPNGKVDRRALPEPERLAEAEGSMAPRTPEEEILAGIWVEVLGLERIGAEDNFFDLGGHSLLAMQVTSRVRSAFGIELPLRELFEAPTVGRLARRIVAARQAGGGLPAAPPLTRRERQGEVPLSFAQQRLWFLDQLEPGSWTYNIPLALRIEGPLDPGALAAALDGLVRRHEALRTVFSQVAGEPVQVVRSVGAALPRVDLTGLLAGQRDVELLRLAGQEARRPFDLERDPMLRAALVGLDEEDHALLLTVHHIAGDGWSTEILARELAVLYGAARSGLPSLLPELAIQYADFAQWQRGWLAGEVLEAELGYWRGRLSGSPPALELATDRPRPAVQGSAGRTERLRPEGDLAESLRSLARQQASTLFMVVLAGWQALLGRYSGQADLNVGTPIAGRNRLELEGLIGLFVNTLVLRGDLSGDPSVGELLGRVKEVVLEAHAHQDLPFEKLVEELQPERSLAHSPLFQVMLVLQSAARSEAVDPAFLRTSRLGVEAEAAKFDLTLGVEERRGAGLSLALSYRTDLFDAPTAKRMLRHLEALLGGLAEDREQRLSALPLLSEAERAQLLVEWNEAGAPVGISERCLHERFAEQAARSPGAVALIDGERETSYGELDRQSSRLAHRLRSLGAGPEVPVALCLERGAGMVVAILGVLKAGAAYVPLDPAYPPERLHLMLEDSAAPFVVTESALAGALPEHPARRVLLDADREMLDGQSAASLAAGACPDNLAYVIYTSGSTGRPKGVAITHRSAAVLLGWAEEVYGAQQVAGVLAATSICFDLSIFELFVPLTRGGAVVLAAHALALPGLPGASRVTLVNTVPSVMAELVRSAGLPASVRTVNLAGESLPPLLVEQVYAAGAVREVYNLYGPTEDTTYSTWALMAREPGAACTIGRPISGTRACLLDAHLNPVPLGAAGELSLGGEGLARGYLRRPDLTAERFVPDPFGEPGARRYRTGDLARQRPDGRLDFLGRIDHQVKIRGFRIEPGEIESALRSHAEVDQAVVLTREDRPGDRRLVAYIVERGRGSVSESELRAYLRRTLPEYMVPSAFVELDSLPLTPNGKLDRRALPEPERRTAAGADLAPRDGIEHDLQKIWEEVLGVPVGMADNFFDLGGHSLLAIKLITRIRRQFGGALPVAALFETGTIESLAPQLRRAGPRRSSPLVRIHAGTGPETLFFVHPGGGGVFGYAPLARRLDARRFYGFQAPGLEGEREPLGSVEELAELYLDAVASVRPEGPCLLGGWSMGGLVALEMARRLEDEKRSVDLVVLLDTRMPAAVSPQPDDDLRLLAAFAAEIGLPAEHLRLSPEELSRLDPELRLAWILERAQAERVLPPDMDTRLLERRLAVLRSNVQAMRSYPVRSYGGEVVLFAAEDAPPEAAEAWRPAIPRLQVEISRGTHFTLVHEPHVNLLAERLQAHLRRISESENTS